MSVALSGVGRLVGFGVGGVVLWGGLVSCLSNFLRSSSFKSSFTSSSNSSLVVWAIVVDSEYVPSVVHSRSEECWVFSRLHWRHITISLYFLEHPLHTSQ